ncbi:MAG: restriction endonuclease subunit S [Anaerolineae bacterium]|nr:restriction endonuclease subunit S [Anaerolineae bacterium]
MKLNPGYKQTEIGTIPDTWDVVPIGDLLTEFRGGAPLKPSDFTDIGVKVLPKGGVGRTGWLQIADSDLKFCSPEYAAANHRSQVDKTYTIVVLRDLVPSGPSIGLMVQIRGQDTFILAQGVYGFKVNESVVPGYLVQLSNTHWYRTLANSIMVGSTQVHITNTAFKLTKIPLPPLAEQEAIAGALSDADALIEALEQLIAKKRQVKQGAMQELLTGKRRLPGFRRKWENKRLGDIANFFKGKGLSKSVISKDGARKCILYGELFTKYKERIQEIASYTDVGDDAFLSQSNDVLMPTSDVTPNGLATASCIQEDGVIIGGDILVIRSKDINGIFLSYMIGYQRTQILQLVTGTTVYHLYASDMRKFSFSVPTLEEQTAIAAVLSDMDAEIAALEAKLAKTRLIKQGMMQELLTGRIRLL